MPPKLFDTHTHFNFNAFKDDWEETIERTLKENVWFVNVGAEAKTSRRAVDIAQKYPAGVYAAVGLHPIHTFDYAYKDTSRLRQNPNRLRRARAEEFNKKYYAQLAASSEKVVAIGETGLDYFHIKDFSSPQQKKLKNRQKEAFAAQIELAAELNKPIIIHCRHLKNYDAYKDVLNILESNKNKLSKTSDVAHFFAADQKLAKKFLDLGFMLGFNGVITFTENYDEVVKFVPLDKIVLETDAPWLTPVPYRGKRNESIYVREVARKIAEIKKVDFEEATEVTTNNALEVFNI